MPKYWARVVLLADHKWRDLPGLATIKVWLEERFRIQTIIASVGSWRSALVTFQPHLIALTHMSGVRNQLIARRAKEMGAAIAVIPTEGRPNTKELMEWATGRFSDVSQVDLWFVWSATMKDFMVESEVLSRDRIVVGGVPRFDFYVPPLRSLLMSREQFVEEYGLMPGKPVVSWATNFTLSRFAKRDQDLLLIGFKDLAMDRLDTFQNPQEVAKHDFAAQQKTLLAMHLAAGEFPDVNFVIKPHPAEDVAVYVNFITKCRSQSITNISLVTERYIWDVLNAADVHIHRLCTTGIEAWFLGLNTINFHVNEYGGWSLNEEEPAAQAVAGEDVVLDQDRLMERLRHYLSGGRLPREKKEARERYIRSWLYRVDGESSKRHAQAICEFLQVRCTLPPISLSQIGIYGLSKMLARRSLGLPFDATLRLWQRKKAGITVDRIGQRDRIVEQSDVVIWSNRVRSVLGDKLVRP
jgi:surface carbohydrate biosynthesis protein